MFKYVYPQFEKKRLLRGEMLDQLRDYPKNYIKMSFQGYGDGVLAGCKLTWDNARLTVLPGIILYKGSLYIMETPYEMDCTALDRMRYLKVQFLAEERENGSIVGNTRISLDDEKPNQACEIELCRFRLQEGAKLRDEYEGFEDYSTLYDTINLIHAPYAAEGGSTLNPLLLKTFAKEIISKGSEDTMDCIFSMNILANSGHVPMDFIQEYLMSKTGENVEGQSNLYRGLLEVLKSQKSGRGAKVQNNQTSRSVMLL